jgi:hypothetical protein
VRFTNGTYAVQWWLTRADRSWVPKGADEFQFPSNRFDLVVDIGEDDKCEGRSWLEDVGVSSTVAWRRNRFR